MITRSRSKRAISSSRDMIVVSPSGAQPSSARKFISAGATYPSSRSSSTPCAPWRLESFLPSVPSTFGTCAYTGRLAAGRADDVDLLRRVGDVVVAADHVRDPVPHVLHRRGEVVGRAPVRAKQDEILELLVRELDPPLHHVVPAGHALVRHPEPDRALVLVRLALGDELPRRLAAVVEAVELVGRWAVPVEPEPGERLERVVDGALHLAARVRVLDPDQELAALVAREEPVEERGANAADVERAGRARRHADADGHAGIVDRGSGR